MAKNGGSCNADENKGRGQVEREPHTKNDHLVHEHRINITTLIGERSRRKWPISGVWEAFENITRDSRAVEEP